MGTRAQQSAISVAVVVCLCVEQVWPAGEAFLHQAEWNHIRFYFRLFCFLFLFLICEKASWGEGSEPVISGLPTCHTSRADVGLNGYPI